MTGRSDFSTLSCRPRPARVLSGLLSLLMAVIVSGCGAQVYHMVRPSETLYSISFRYGRDFHDVARWNGIDPPYRIYPGQQIRIAPPLRDPFAAPAAQPAAAPAVAVTETPGAAVAPSAAPQQPPEWRWPVLGGTVQVSNGGAFALRGLDIAGYRGQPVRAAAAGRVVYSGSGIPHYGKLLIIKHDEHFLSAYAHNERLLVQEGAVVTAGQRIAEMGDSGTGTDTVRLHFEIRRDGVPVDPVRYLPREREE